jgi:hypothetical protein
MFGLAGKRSPRKRRSNDLQGWDENLKNLIDPTPD